MFTSELNLKLNYQWYSSPSQELLAVCTALMYLYRTHVCATCMGPRAQVRFSFYVLLKLYFHVLAVYLFASACLIMYKWWQLPSNQPLEEAWRCGQCKY